MKDDDWKAFSLRKSCKLKPSHTCAGRVNVMVGPKSNLRNSSFLSTCAGRVNVMVGPKSNLRNSSLLYTCAGRLNVMAVSYTHLTLPTKA